jgi:type IV pilus assembly protein PilB
MANNRLGELLVRKQLITDIQLAKALEDQKANGGRLGATLVGLGFIKEEVFTSFLSQQYGVPSINLNEFEIDPSVIKLVPAEVAQKHNIIPINRTGATLIIAMSDPSNINAIDELRFRTGYAVVVVVTSENSIRVALDQYYDQSASFSEAMMLDDIDLEVVEESEVDAHALESAAEEAPVVKLVNLILTDAIKRKASDIHIEPYELSFRVRYRIDGVLYEVMKPPMKLKNAITSRVKIMAEMDIAERRLPQDGRIKIKLPRGAEMDYRVN